MIEQSIAEVIIYYKQRNRLWKQTAKMLRRDFYIAQGSFLDAMKLLREAEAEATRLRGLLRLYESARKQSKEICFFCAGEWTHTDDCELAKALVSDQREEELKDE